MSNQEQELRVFRGLPGSGKSTEAEKLVQSDPDRWVRVNRDDIRFELYNKYVILNSKGEMDKNAENHVTEVEKRRMNDAFKAGKSVVSDNTNLGIKTVKKHIALAQSHGVKVTHQDFPVPLEEVQRRNAARSRVVEPWVINRMHKQSMGPNGEFHLFPGSYPLRPFVKPASKEHAVVYDMDGTTTDISGIRHFVRGKYRNFDAFHRSSLFCPPNQDVLDMMHDTAAAGLTNIVVTARNREYEDVTVKWLDDHNAPFSNIYMRKDGDQRKDNIVKAEILEDILVDYDVVHAVDDRPEVIEVWHSAGIQTTLVPGIDYTDEEIAAGKPISIVNPLRAGRCLRCGRPISGGRALGPTCEKIG
jgi:predicted kinase